MKTIIDCTILLFVILIAFSCNKSKNDKKDNNVITKITTCYNQTGCADPWDKGINDSALVSNVKSFLLSDSINVIDVAISNDGIYEGCKACTCTTGKRIKAVIYNNDLNKIERLRFYKCK